ncbi:hypothetical protein BK720_01625 [Bacillus thuringiensis serovar brasilensis]|uniref:hypothetical protein n=1 Tax=Bacillus cereus group TaxID=86661 RepID=UPI000A3A6118|nr:hypothetical protein [Bacillus thuringiensis]MCU5031543.1 hypothetical protein [Bacillus cereus]MRA75112.1 hypothetical protein [Bacillus thuringiensis]MRA92358.1 hypothetical protein [Bacillus thuringiensis]MRC54646.1 hypothetical protein [Bacillus thuringiensis]OTX39032.1 hypothetical protein BK720_01625 [Bacillus thuringiensis serovar brasilensis]
MSTVLEKCLAELSIYSQITNREWRDYLELDVQSIDNNYTTFEELLAYYNELPIRFKDIFNSYSLDSVPELLERDDVGIKSLLLTFIKIKAFLSGKLEQVKIDYYESKLSEESLEQINSMPKYCKDIYSCLLIPGNKIEILQDILYLCLANTFSYIDYHLSLDLEGITDLVEQEELRNQLEDGYDMDTLNINAANIDRALLIFEENQENNFNIQCRYIIRLENEMIIFILREDSRAAIRKIEEYLVDSSANWTVLRFYDGFKKLKVRSPLKNPDDLSTKIINAISDIETFFYVPSNKVTSLWSFTKFFVRLLGGKINNLELLEIKINPLGITGAPSFILRRESNVSLKDSVDAIKNNGFKLIRSVKDIEYIKVDFIEGASKNTYTLKFHNVSNGTLKYIEFMGRGKLLKRQRFIDILEAMNINVNEGNHLR